MSDRKNVYIDTDKRLFYLYDDIDRNAISKMCFSLLELIGEDNKKDEKEKDFKRVPISIFINSYGGDVYDMWALIDIIEKSKTPIHTYCNGYAMSAGFNIFLAGHKKFATKHATFMYHQMTCGIRDKYQDVVENLDEMNFLNKQLEDYVLEKTKLTKSYINEIREKKKDVYFHAEEALKHGIIDEII